MMRSLLCIGAAASALAIAGDARAQVDMAAAIAELKEANRQLAARIETLERELAARPAAATGGEPASPPATPPAATAHAAPPPSAAVSGREVTLTVPPAPLSRPIQGAGVGLQIAAGSAGGQVSLSLSQGLRKTGVRDDQVAASGTTWSLSLTAPVAKSGDTKPATLDSFADSTTLRLSIGRLHLTMPNLLTDAAYLQLRERATAACIAAAGADAAQVKECQEAAYNQGFVAKWLPHEVGAYIDLTTRQRFAWGYGLEASVGYREFAYLDPARVASDKAKRVPWGVRLYGTVIPRPDRALVASIAYQQGYEESAATVICPASTGTAPVNCLSGANGLPSRNEKVLLTLEGRRLFDLRAFSSQNGLIDRFALAPQIVYDLNNDDFGVDVPLYLAADDKGNLIGGLRVGYKTGEEGFNMGVFIGAAFDLGKR